MRYAEVADHISLLLFSINSCISQIYTFTLQRVWHLSYIRKEVACSESCKRSMRHDFLYPTSAVPPKRALLEIACVDIVRTAPKLKMIENILAEAGLDTAI